MRHRATRTASYPIGSGTLSDVGTIGFVWFAHHPNDLNPGHQTIHRMIHPGMLEALITPGLAETILRPLSEGRTV